jgi:UDP-N-acetylmuramoylalanine--D-glutamate ligase
MANKNHTIVLGLGVTGLSCIRYLQQLGERLTVYDTRINPPGLTQFNREFSNIELVLGPFNAEQLTQADRIVISPGLSIHNPLFALARQKNIPIIGDVELFAQNLSAPVVAITGTNGKSTVTTILGEMAKAAGINVVIAGNIGTPVCDLLNQPQAELYVLELSSFQLATTMSLKPVAATVLNVTPDHLDWHTSFEDYSASKLRIYDNATYCVTNSDDKNTWIDKASYSFTAHQPNNNAEFGIHRGWLVQGEKPLFAIKDLKIIGLHNQLNALSALALGAALNLPLQAMQQVLKNFAGLAHRCQFVTEQQHVRWYNDSKATNVAATISSLKSLAPMVEGKLVLLAGGDAKAADVNILVPSVIQYVRALILYGKDKQLLADALQNTVTLVVVDDLAQAVAAARELAQPGDAVLLAPACSSLDMFKDYQDRGNQFIKLVTAPCQN